MRRLAPRARNSCERRSPTSSETLKAAVTTAMPRARAAPVSSLRRGRRPNESATRRRNIIVGESDPQLTRNLLSCATQAGKIHHNVAAINVRGNADGIAATLIADGRNVDGGAAMTADDILAVLSIAFRATDATSIESCAISVGLLDDHESQRLVRDVYGEKMEFSIIHLGERNANFLAVGGNRRRRWRDRIGARVNKIGGEYKNHYQTRGGSGHHPVSLTAILRFEQAFSGFTTGLTGGNFA